MPVGLRQIVELAKLVVRSLLRRGGVAGSAPRLEPRRQVASALLLLLFVGIMSFNFWNVGAAAKTVDARSILLLVVACAAAGTAFMGEVQGPGRRRFLGGPFLDTLPVEPGARLVISLGQNFYLWVLTTVVFFAASPVWRHSPAGAAALVALGSLWSGATLIGALGVVAVIRLTVPSHRVSRVLQICGYATLAALFLAFLLPGQAAVHWPRWLPNPFELLARALGVHVGWGLLAGTLPAFALIAVAGVVMEVVERRGYDRLEAAPPNPSHASKAGRLTLPQAEKLLVGRQGGRWLTGLTLFLVVGGWAGYGFVAHLEGRLESAGSTDAGVSAPRHGAVARSAADAGSTVAKKPSAQDLAATERKLKEVTRRRDELQRQLDVFKKKKESFPELALLVVGLFAVEVGGVLSLSRGVVAVRRDVMARPFLAPLPIAPAETLEGKAASLRPPVLIIALAYVPFVFVAPVALKWAVVWHGATILAALLLLCEAAPAVSFLSNGLGSPSVASMGTPLNFAGLLLLLPAIRVAVAESVGGALLSVAALAALTFEARRAASGCLRWLDDAADDVERDTPVWRALLVFAGFVAIQGLSFELLGLGGGLLPAGWTLPGSYIVSAVALLLMTLVSRRGLPPLRLWPQRTWLLPLGAVAGLATGLLGLGYLRLLDWLGWSPPDSSALELDASPWGLALAVVVAAPIAEELFFRGWLQAAVGVELSEKSKRWAFVIAAAAFAVIHPPISFLPVLLLGLAAGWLYELGGGLLPGMLAHATHNGIALLFGQ